MDSGSALANYNTFTAQMQNPDQIAQGTESSLGIPQATQEVSGLRQAITNTTNLLNNVAPSVMGRTQNSLVTAAQAGKQIQNESAPIQSKLAGETTAASNAASDLNALQSKAANQESLKASTQSNQQSALMDLYKTLLSSEQNKAQQAESTRQFNATNAIDQQNANSTSKNAATSATKSAAATYTPQDVAAANGDLIKLRGGDGYVSPQTYARTALSWANAGYSLSDFNKLFAKYKNPDNPNYTL